MRPSASEIALLKPTRALVVTQPPTITSATTTTFVAGSAATFSVTASTSTPTAGTPFSITVTARNSSGQTLTSYTGTVHFTTTDKGTGEALPSNYTFTTADQGQLCEGRDDICQVRFLNREVASTRSCGRIQRRSILTRSQPGREAVMIIADRLGNLQQECIE